MNRIRLEPRDLVALALLAGSAAVAAGVYARLPEAMPIHFDVRGQADSFVSKSIGAWLLPLLGLGAWALVRFTPVLAPKTADSRGAAAPFGAVAFVLAASFSALQVVVLRAALSPSMRLGGAAAIVLGVTWLSFAQLFPKLRRNRFVGVRTPWTLTSDENWLRTHRVAAYAAAFGGAVAVVAGLIGGQAGFGIAVAAVLSSAIAPAIYSFALARSLTRR
jgi:uncharacterized membrane protein